MEEVHTPKRVAVQPGRRRKGVLIAAGCAAAVLLAAYLGLCAWVGGSPNILKGVSVAGVPVGGLTREQALETLEDNLGQVSSVALPLEYGPWEGEITAAAVRVDDQATVAQAWQTGRENFLLQGASYLSHQLGAEDEIGLTLAWTDDGKAELEAKMDEADLQVGGALTNATYAVEGDKLMLTKGVTGVTIDREAAEPMVMAAMTEAVSDAMQGGTAAVEPVVLPAHETTPQEPDFDAMYQELHAEAKSAEIDPETLEVSDHVVGVDFDVNQAKTLFDAAAEGETVEIPLTITQPEETKEGLEGKLFRDLLGEGTSRVGGSANRKSNVKLSAQACNGVVLMPGEVFSYNNTTGSRTADKGYLGAPVYSGGASVEGIGGGICQTSSTLYLACLRSNLEITERYAHRYVPAYITAGMDATVSWGGPDYKFTNNSLYPIKIVTIYENNYLTVRILGTNVDGTSVKMTNEWLSTTPYETVYEDDPTLAPGTEKVKTTPYTGYKYRTYRNVYDANGKLISSTYEATSDYKSRNKVILRGPAVEPADGGAQIPTDTTEPTTPVEPTEPQDPDVPAEPTEPTTPDNGWTIQTPEQDGQQTAEGQTGTGTTGESELSTDVLPQDEPFV